jgi:transcriptional regulator with XRE-family HTH domain
LYQFDYLFMTLGEHITTLRKKNKLSQQELGKRANTSGDLVGRYERDEVKPSIEVVIKLADALGVSLDFLVGNTDLELDREAVKRLEQISKLPEEERLQLFNVVDALLRDFNAKQAYS